jgi:hypothetical protein
MRWYETLIVILVIWILTAGFIWIGTSEDMWSAGTPSHEGTVKMLFEGN